MSQKYLKLTECDHRFAFSAISECFQSLFGLLSDQKQWSQCWNCDQFENQDWVPFVDAAKFFFITYFFTTSLLFVCFLLQVVRVRLFPNEGISIGVTISSILVHCSESISLRLRYVISVLSHSQKNWFV